MKKYKIYFKFGNSHCYTRFWRPNVQCFGTFVAVTIAKHVILERLLLLAPWVDPWCAPWRGAMVRAMAPVVPVSKIICFAMVSATKATKTLKTTILQAAIAISDKRGSNLENTSSIFILVKQAKKSKLLVFWSKKIFLNNFLINFLINFCENFVNARVHSTTHKTENHYMFCQNCEYFDQNMCVFLSRFDQHLGKIVDSFLIKLWYFLSSLTQILQKIVKDTPSN